MTTYSVNDFSSQLFYQDNKHTQSNIVTYVINVFIPLSNGCRNKCAYCGFRSDNPFLLLPNDVIKILRGSKRAWEALFTFGERPEVHKSIRTKLKEIGFKNFIDYVIEMNKLAISTGLLPHTNAGVISKIEMKKLRRYNASLGLMLEQAVELECHRFSPGKKPEKRIKVIKNAGKLKIPFTTGILIGIGEKREDRIYSLEVISDLHENYGHIQEVIIQNFTPKKGTPMENWPSPTVHEMLDTVKIAREILPDDVTIQIPPNLVKDVYPFIKAGARDIGGISDYTPDYINPEHPWPSIEELKKRLGKEFVLKPRLSIYPKFVKMGWFSDEISDLILKLADDDGFKREI